MPGLITTNGANGNAVPTMAGTGTKVAIWDLLQNEHTEKEAPENTEALLSVKPGEESVVGADERVLVPKEDYAPGGKYRAVVKLFLRFEGQETDDPWALASGWLIRNDLVVTAGHCAFDHSHDLGRLTHVKAYIGYHGNESINDPSYAVQFRTAKQVVTTQNWLEDGTNEAYDVSFIVLTSPFTDVTPIQFQPTPQSSTSKIGVVGYPGDLMDSDTGERGAYMWEMYQQTSWDLATSWAHMLQYKIDTYGGNSGSVVFLQPPAAASDAKSIGVHVYGGNTNSASVIGRLGNDFSIYLAALDGYNSGVLPAGATKETNLNHPWLTYVNIPSQDHESSGSNGTSGSGDGTETNIGDGPGTLGGKIEGVDESLLDFLNKAMKVVGPIASTALQVGLPMALGPVGAPIGALAGVALNVAGKLAGSATGTEADTGKSYTFDGVAERAVLGEAAIASLKHLGNAKCKSLGIFDSMNDIVKKAAPTVQDVAPKVMGAVAEPALRMTLDSLSKAQAGTEANFKTPPIRHAKKKETDTTGFAPRLSPSQEEFITSFGSTFTKEDTESFLGVTSSIGSIIRKGLRVAGPIISSVAQAGLPLLLKGTESSEGPTSPFSFEGLAERSLIGDAALTSLMNVPTKTLQEEGVFDAMKKVVTTIGPAVLRTAPSVISAVTPIVHGILQSKSNGHDEAFINPGGNVMLEAADIARWRGNGGYQGFANWMHTLHALAGGGPQALGSIIANNNPTPHQFGLETVFFAMYEYAGTIAQALHISEAAVQWRNYLKVFGTLNAGGVPAAVMADNLRGAYPSLQAAQLTTIRNVITGLPAVQRPLHENAVWFWFFVFSAIENGGTVVLNGSDVVLTAHEPDLEAPTEFAFPGGRALTLTMNVGDYVALIKNMMLAFTVNTYPPNNALNIW